MNRKWNTLLLDVVHLYNKTPHDITGFTQHFLLHGTQKSNFNKLQPLEEARELAIDRTKVSQIKIKSKHETIHANAKFNIGDKVIKQIPFRNVLFKPLSKTKIHKYHIFLLIFHTIVLNLCFILYRHY